MKANVRWVSGLSFISSGESGHYTTMDFDEDKAQQKASSPTELLLQAMCGCTAMDVLTILKNMKEPVKGIEVNVNGTRASYHPKVFTEIDIEYVVYGDINKENFEKAIGLSQEKYCNISITLKRSGTKMNVSSKVKKNIDD